MSTSTASNNLLSHTDNDSDGDHGNDDIRWGLAADPGELRVATSLVKRYYAAAAAGDGATGCALLYTLFEEEVVELYGEGAGPASLRGTSCPEVVTKLYRQHHRELSSINATLKVVGMRVKLKRAIVLLSYRGARGRDIPVHLEHGAWKVDALLDGRVG